MDDVTDYPVFRSDYDAGNTHADSTNQKQFYINAVNDILDILEVTRSDVIRERIARNVSLIAVFALFLFAILV
jgi:hypothetical protein